MSSFPVLDVTDWPVRAEEPTGDDEKEWLESPDGHLWLFKPRVTHDGWNQGEDWAEKISGEVASTLSVPAAKIELAVRHGDLGSLSRNLRPSGWELQPGGVALFGLLGEYETRAYQRKGHSIANIRRVLEGCEPPPEYQNGAELSAFGVFAGYLVLDALIANQDRHDHNWAVLRPPEGDGPQLLCGSYDHASSLGFNRRDSFREQRLIARTVAEWARRGRAQRFEHRDGETVPTLVELAAEGLRVAGVAAREHWLDNISLFDDDRMATLVEAVPSMSDLSRSFAVEVMRTNRGRVLNEC